MEAGRYVIIGVSCPNTAMQHVGWGGWGGGGGGGG